MNTQEIQAKITKLEGEAASIVLKSRALQLAGGIGGVFVAKDKKILGKIGFFLLGSLISGIGTTMVYSKRLTEIVAELENLNLQLEILLATNPKTV